MISGCLYGFSVLWGFLENQKLQIQLPPVFRSAPPESHILTFLKPPKQGILVKEGNRLKYTSLAGTEIKEFRKGWTGDKLDVIMGDILSGGQQTTDDNISSEVEEQPTEGE